MTIDWAARVISIPRTDLTLVQTTPIYVYDMDMDWFRLTLKDLEDDEAGITFPNTHNHYPPVNVGGVILSRVIELINGYSVSFEDDHYAVNIVGANTNLMDRLIPSSVSVRTANSAGLQMVTPESNVTNQDKIDIAAQVWIKTLEGSVTASEMMRLIMAMLAGDVLAYDVVKAFNDAAKTRFTFTTDDNGNRTLVSFDASE